VLVSVQIKEVSHASATPLYGQVQDENHARSPHRAKIMAQICCDYNLKDQVVRCWKTDFLDRVEPLFGRNTDRQQYLE
jgi:hypothetical protein